MVLLPDVIMVNDVPVTRQLISHTNGTAEASSPFGRSQPQEVERHGIVRV